MVETAQQASAQSVASAAQELPRPPRLWQCRIPATTTRGRRIFQGQRRVHGVCTEGRVLLNVGDRGGGNGLRLSHVREAGVVASGRPFNGSGPDSHVLYALCRTGESRPDHCPRQGPADGLRRAPRPCLMAEPRRKSWRKTTEGNSDAATVAPAGTATVGVAAKMVGWPPPPPPRG